jgi:hypothetical protein
MFIDVLLPSTEISWQPVFLLPEWHIILFWTNHGRYSLFPIMPGRFRTWRINTTEEQLLSPNIASIDLLHLTLYSLSVCGAEAPIIHLYWSFLNIYLCCIFF